MKCPRCVQRIHRAAEACPHCGFSLTDADERFGGEAVRLRRLTDAAGIFRRDDREKAAIAIEAFTRRFPQLFVAVYTGSLGEIANLRQFGLWLLNRGTFEDVPAEIPNEAGILITIDPDSKAAGIAFGYQLDAFLDEADTFDALLRAHAAWLEGHYADGLTKVLGHLEKILRRRSRQARRDPERFEKKVVPAATLRDRLHGLRSGHRLAHSAAQEVPK